MKSFSLCCCAIKNLEGYIATLRHNSEELKMNMECNFGLLDMLAEKNLLSEEQRSSILRLTHVYMQNVELLDNIMLHKERFQDFEVFFDAMRSTGQGHLVKYILEGLSKGFDVC